MDAMNMGPGDSTAYAVVVNDDPIQLKVLSKLVGMAGLEPCAFTGVEAALVSMEQEHLPALIVTDLHMPGIDGWRFCRLLRSPEYARFNQIPIVVVSATFTGEEPDRIAADLGAEIFLPTPVNGKQFIEQVRAILNGERVRNPLRVLIVEDSTTLANMLQKAFEENSYRVDTALTVQEADDALGKNVYDVAVMDYHLPDGESDKLLVRFQKEQPDCVCLMMTTDQNPELALKWMLWGASAFLKKPFQPAYLIELCARARRERALLRVQDLLEARTRELRESELKCRSLIESSSDAIFCVDERGQYQFVNQVFASTLGHSPEYFAGKTFWDVYPKEHADYRFAATQRVIQTGRSESLEVEVPLPTGSLFFYATANPIRDDMGNVVLALTHATDITVRKRAEEELQNAHSLLVAAIDSTSDGILVVDRMGKVTSVNRVFLEMWRIPESVAARRDDEQLRQYVVEQLQDPDAFLDKICKLYHTPDASSTDELAFKDGRVFERFSQPQRIGDIIVGRVWSFRDITKRKRAEEALQESNKRYRALFEQAGDGIFLLDATGKLISVNEAFANMHGYTEEEMLRLGLQGLDVEGIGPVPDRMRRIMAGEALNFEVEHYHKDGHIFPIAVTANLITSGNEQFVIAIHRDLTERKRAEAALEEARVTFDAVFESSPAAMLVLDEKVTIILANPAAVVLAGGTESDVLQHRPGNALNCVHSTKDPRGCGYTEDCTICPLRNGIQALMASGDAMHGAELPLVLMRNGSPREVWLRVNANHLVINRRPHLCVALEDITEHKHAEIILLTRLQLASLYEWGSLDELIQGGLDAAELLTGSTIGFFHFVDEDQENLTLQTWSTNTLKNMCKAEGKGRHYPVTQAGVWVDCVTSRVPVIHNDYPGLLHKKGLPQGHAPVMRELVVPILRNDSVVAIIGVGNKPTNYIEDDAKLIQELLLHILETVDRKRAEEALRKSEAQYRHIVENAPMGIFRRELEGKFQYVNPGLIRQLECKTAKEFQDNYGLISQRWAHPERYDEFKALLLENRSVFGYENECRLVGGATKWFALYSFLDDSEQFISGFSLDITERKRAEEALKKSEEHYRSIVNTAQEGIWILDADHLTTFVNPRMAQMLGRSPQEIMGRPAHAFMPEFEWEDHGRQMERRKVGLSGVYERLLRHADGVELPTFVSATPLIDGQGRFYGSFAMFTDITELKRAEDELRQSKARLDAILLSMKDVVFEIDVNGYFQGYYAQRNKKFYIQPDSFIGKKFDEVLPENVSVLLQQALESIYAGKPYQQIEYSIDIDNTTKYENAVVTRRYNTSNEIIGVTVVCRDVTEQKHAEEEKAKLEAQLRQAQKMESVGRLAGGVAHDFNNMLSVIIGHAEISLMAMDPTNPLHAGLMEIRSAAERSANLTRQLLTFARKQVIAPRELDVNETVEGMLNMLRRLISENVELKWLPGANVGLVKIDPSQIDQILANLCVNARDAISDVGKMTIETGSSIFDEDYCATHAGFLQGEYVWFAVSDNGCGMDKETVAIIFEPFFTTKEMGKGTGLGLATVYGAVKQNNGFINVYSEPGLGTTFTIYLPRYMGKAEQMGTNVAVEPNALGHETILLVDDEASIVTMNRALLEKQGYTVLAANTPGEAIRMAESHPGEIHLLMADVVMPEMNGLNLAKKLRLLYPHIKCLFMSGYTADIIAPHGALDEGLYYIQKPFSMIEMGNKIREILETTAS